jgi:small subunit ribosomal protein S2
MSEPVVTMKQLLDAGVHFGHQTRRWNPKMKRFIFGDRNGIYIIDLQQTLKRIETAYTAIRDTVADGGTVLFVGTKKQAQDPIQSYAEKSGSPFINQRWLGGMLTNFETMSKRVSKMQEYRRMRDSGEFEAMPKKEALLISRELEKLERNLGGIAKMERLPDLVFILDTKKEHIAVTEANKLGIPIVAVVDTNCDPDVISFPIPGNDDAIRSGTLMSRVIADAVEEGHHMASQRPGAKAPIPAPPKERSADEEAAIAAQQADARRQATEAAAQREARIAAQQAAPQPDGEVVANPEATPDLVAPTTDPDIDGATDAPTGATTAAEPDATEHDLAVEAPVATAPEDVAAVETAAAPPSEPDTAPVTETGPETAGAPVPDHTPEADTAPDTAPEAEATPQAEGASDGPDETPADG